MVLNFMELRLLDSRKPIPNITIIPKRPQMKFILSPQYVIKKCNICIMLGTARHHVTLLKNEKK